MEEGQSIDPRNRWVIDMGKVRKRQTDAQHNTAPKAKTLINTLLSQDRIVSTSAATSTSTRLRFLWASQPPAFVFPRIKK